MSKIQIVRRAVREAPATAFEISVVTGIDEKQASVYLGRLYRHGFITRKPMPVLGERGPGRQGYLYSATG